MSEFRQEMPPIGGYQSITYQKIPLKSVNIYFKWAVLVAFTTFGWIGFHINKRKLSNETIEMRCGRLAILPLLQAENDRMVIQQLRKNREMEEEIMKDVKGWEVGKWKKFPVYFTVGPNEYFHPSIYEYFMHSDPKHKDWLFQLHKTM